MNTVPSGLLRGVTTVHIPVVWKAGQWAYPDGPVPKFKEGVVAELRVNVTNMFDWRDAKRFSHEETVPFIEQGRLLLACMTLKEERPKEAYDFPEDKRPLDDLGYSHYFIPFVLDEPLMLRLRGTKPAQLMPCQCHIPALGPDFTTESVNQAYTRLSETYEPWRKSHTGAVFQKVYLAELQNGHLVSLGDLRAQIKNPSTP